MKPPVPVFNVTEHLTSSWADDWQLANLSPVHTSNNVEATLSKQQATLLPVASTMLLYWATMSKQRSTLSKGRNFNAKLVRHCCRFWQQSWTLLRHCCWCGPGFTFNIEFTCYSWLHGGEVVLLWHNFMRRYSDKWLCVTEVAWGSVEKYRKKCDIIAEWSLVPVLRLLFAQTFYVF